MRGLYFVAVKLWAGLPICGRVRWEFQVNKAKSFAVVSAEVYAFCELSRVYLCWDTHGGHDWWRYSQSITKAYGRVDSDGSRYLLSDHNGMLYLLVISHDKERSVLCFPSSIIFLRAPFNRGCCTYLGLIPSFVFSSLWMGSMRVTTMYDW